MLFDDLADLALIEIFKYLSSLEILWSFSDLNARLTALLIERSCFRQVNLSFARRHQFDILVHRLPLNTIESLIIDVDASPLQLSSWPYLPRLTTLRLRSILNLDDVSSFVLKHASTLTHLTLEPNKYLINNISFHLELPYSKYDFTSLIEKILRHLTSIQSLDLGYNRELLIRSWDIVSLPMTLTYLRLSLCYIPQLFLIMSTPPLSNTLQEFHVTMQDKHIDFELNEFDMVLQLPQMKHLWNFTFVKPFFSDIYIKWEIIEAMTRSSVMPGLRRINLAMVIDFDDLDSVCQSEFFDDHRHIDIQFALSLIDWPLDIKVNEIVLRTSHFHPRQIVNATLFIDDQRNTRWSDDSTVCVSDRTSHMWYTLPWSFDDFFQLRFPKQSIRKVEAFEQCPQMMPISPSRLRILVASGDAQTLSILDLPHVVQLNRIEMLEFSFCEKPLGVMLPALRHVTLINCLNLATVISSLPPTVRSLHILFYYQSSCFVAPDWKALHSVQSLPLFNSLMVILYDMKTMIDLSDCDIIAQTAIKLAHFAIFCRPHGIIDDRRIESMSINQCISINDIHSYIYWYLDDKLPSSAVESCDHGLTVWFN